jgi:hypothetical protein
MPRSSPSRLIRNVAATALAGVAAHALAGSPHAPLPQLGEARPASLIGSCDAMAEGLGALPGTQITA